MAMRKSLSQDLSSKVMLSFVKKFCVCVDVAAEFHGCLAAVFNF
jgi:hypothetical protein